MRTAFGRRFDVPDGYLDTASVGVPPVDAADVLVEAVGAWRAGSARAPDHDEPVRRARDAFAALVGVGVDRVAIGASVSSLLGLVAASVPAGARVLVPVGEFTSVSWPFAVQARRRVTLVEADLDEVPARAAEFDLVVASVVQSADGRIVDLDGLRAARGSGTRVVLDATQSVGWLPAELAWADAVVAAGYKWLLSPRGAAWMAVRPELDLLPHHAGWYAADDPWTSVYGLPRRLSPTARRLDTSPAWFSHVGAAAVLPWLAGLDRSAVHAHCVGLADAFRAGLGLPPAGSAITAVAVPDAADRLAAAGVTASVRAGRARLAFHLYNTGDDVQRALDALR